MKNFKAKDIVITLDPELRSQIKPGWEEMLFPAKKRNISPNLMSFIGAVIKADDFLSKFGENLIGKNILEVGCNEGARAYLMAKYQDTKVHGIDVDEYTVDQSPDLNAWNPEDIKFVHNKFDSVRAELGAKFPPAVSGKVSFETTSIEEYKSDNPHDLIISWDTIEHIIDLPKAFQVMARSLKKGGISYHEYNPFFALNGGHSLCTLDFLYGHCRLSNEDFERYIREIRPDEEKIALNFYNKCLNKATRADIRKYAEDAGFEILQFDGTPSFGSEWQAWKKKIEMEFIDEVKENYPTVSVEDLMCDFLQLIMRKK